MPPRIDRARVQDMIVAMLSAEQYCGREELLGPDVYVIEAGPRPDTVWIPGGRWFDRPEPYFSLVSLGVGGVVTASPELMSWVRPLYEGTSRDQMMEPVRIAEVSSRMEQLGQKTFGPFPRWVCAEEDLVAHPAPEGYRIEVRDEDPSRPFLADGRRPGERTSTRFRAIALGADGPVGSAGAAADSDDIYQIDIAIREEHRGRGLGRSLTSAVTRAIFDRGGIPYYGTTSVNTWSMRTAISCGFYPAWVHFFSRDVRPL